MIIEKEYLLLKLLLFLSLGGCAISQGKRNSFCACCHTFYTSIDSSRNCIAQTPNEAGEPDDRLYLLAFVNKDIGKDSDKGWSILKDQEVINIAKVNYLLVVLDPKNMTFLSEQTEGELLKVIKNHHENLFFVITNQALYPIADWTDTASKDIVIEKLRVGAGP